MQETLNDDNEVLENENIVAIVPTVQLDAEDALHETLNVDTDQGENHENTSNNDLNKDVPENDIEAGLVASEENSVPTGCKLIDTFIRPEVVDIYGTVIIENSPFQAFVQEQLNSLVRFLTAKEHLKKNIMNIDVNPLSSREFNEGSGTFKHTVGLKLSVKTANLWETPRSYIFRHVGQDCWKRGNGSNVNVVGIHQK